MFDDIVRDFIVGPFLVYIVLGVIVGVIVTALCEPFPSRHQRLLSNIVFTLAWPLAIVCGILSFMAYVIGSQYEQRNADHDDSDEDLKETNRLIAARAAKAVATAYKQPVSEPERPQEPESEPKEEASNAK